MGKNWLNQNGGIRLPVSLDNKLVAAISSRALFELAESNKIFETEGVKKYTEYQRDKQDSLF